MRQLRLYLKPNSGRAAAILILLVSIAGLAGYALYRPQQASDKIDRAFFEETKLGRRIVAYVHCIDFDCFTLQSEIVKVGPEALPPLIYLIDHGLPSQTSAQPTGDIRPKVIGLLGAIADTRAQEYLIPLLQDRSPIVRAAAARALGQIKAYASVKPLLRLLDDQDALVRETAAMSLGELGNRDALLGLREALQAEQKRHVRQAIEDAIRAIQDQ